MSGWLIDDFFTVRIFLDNKEAPELFNDSRDRKMSSDHVIFFL
jgi:hypothetical protein